MANKENMPGPDEIDEAHWKGCAPGLDQEEPIYIGQINHGGKPDESIGRGNKLEPQE